MLSYIEVAGESEYAATSTVAVAVSPVSPSVPGTSSADSLINAAGDTASSSGVSMNLVIITRPARLLE